MPREVVKAAGHDRSRSLGILAVDWMEFFTVHGPGDVQGERVVLDDELAGFTVDAYALDDRGRRLYDSAFLSRPKGADKSGHGSRFCLFEALGPCRFAGWAKGGEVYRDPWGPGFEFTYDEGDAMGRPVRTPFVRCMATEEGQTGNVYDTILLNLLEGPLARIPAMKAGLQGAYLPGGGEIQPSTAASASKDGGKETFVDFDESHLYNTPELRRMYAVVTRNLRKRKKLAETWYLETTTMFAAGEESIAEATYKLAGLIREGKVKRERLLFDHRYGECEDLADEPELRSAIEDAFGPAMSFNDLQAIVDEFYDPRASIVDSRRYFLNSASSALDAWIIEPAWAGCVDATKVVADREVVTLGFDGSRKRARGVTDATALIGCRLSDGHVFELGVWEQPDGPNGVDWQVPVSEVEAAVHAAFARWQVVGFYADPAKWESYVAGWEAKYHKRLKARATLQHPVQWWMIGGRAPQVVRALEQFQSAVIDHEMTNDGSWALTRHVLNARERNSRSGMQIAKEHPDSARKIDAAVAAVLAWQARIDALAAGAGVSKTAVPRRIR